MSVNPVRQTVINRPILISDLSIRNPRALLASRQIGTGFTGQ